MLMLMLDEARRMKRTRTKTGEMVCLSLETCEFLFEYCMSCMSPAEARLAMTPKTYKFTEEDHDEV